RPLAARPRGKVVACEVTEEYERPVSCCSLVCGTGPRAVPSGSTAMFFIMFLVVCGTVVGMESPQVEAGRGLPICYCGSFHLCNVLQLCIIPTFCTRLIRHRLESLIFLKKW
uniref:Uncharacterized protein n=1 Tax=Aegilops tauschii subsp. strangulata TaxID=200361 RepID=A0A452Y5X6_AEGTS